MLKCTANSVSSIYFLEIQCVSITVHIYIDEWLLVATYGAGVALVSAPVIKLHPFQLQRRISFRDLILEQRCPFSEALILMRELVLAVIVRVDRSISCCHMNPVDDDVCTGLKSAWQDAAFRENTGDLFTCKTLYKEKYIKFRENSRCCSVSSP